MQAVLQLYQSSGAFAAIADTVDDDPPDRNNSSTSNSSSVLREQSSVLTASSEESLDSLTSLRSRWREFYLNVQSVNEARKYSAKTLGAQHPASAGYAMTHDAEAAAELSDWLSRGGKLTTSIVSSEPAPDYTDDEASEAADSDDDDDDDDDQDQGDEEQNVSSVRKQRKRDKQKQQQQQDDHASLVCPVPASFDPALRSPVFFGYTDSTQTEEILIKRTAADALSAQESAILKRQRARRQAKVSAAQSDAARKRSAREKKVAEAVTALEESKKGRTADLVSLKKSMSHEDYKLAKAELERAELAGSIADRAQLQDLKLKYAALNR